MESLSLNFTLHPANYAILTSPGLLSGAVQETFPIFIYQGCIALGKKIALGVPLRPPLFAPSPSLPPRRCTGGLPPAARLGTGAGPQAVPMPELAGSLRVGSCFAATAPSSLFVGFLLNINKNPESSAALLGEAQNNKMVSSTTWQEHGDEACREKCSVPPPAPTSATGSTGSGTAVLWGQPLLRRDAPGTGCWLQRGLCALPAASCSRSTAPQQQRSLAGQPSRHSAQHSAVRWQISPLLHSSLTAAENTWGMEDALYSRPQCMKKVTYSLWNDKQVHPEVQGDTWLYNYLYTRPGLMLAL